MNFPFIGLDRLVELTLDRYVGAEEMRPGFDAIFNRPFFSGPIPQYVPGQPDIVDLRVVARFALKPRHPAMWRCPECGRKVFRRDARAVYGKRYWGGLGGMYGPTPECSMVCHEQARKRRYEAERYDRQQKEKDEQKTNRRRKREWERIKQCRVLLKQTRSLLRKPWHPEASRLP